MKDFTELLKSADWKTEKQAPVLECPDAVNAGAAVEVAASIGKEIAHPNTALHHIRWIRLFFLPADATLPYEIGSFDFASHGESVLGADTSTLYTEPKVSVDVKTSVPGVIYATAYCNIHGLWESAKAITVVEPAAEE